MDISEATRRDIIDYLITNRVRWSGRLEEPEFLSRLFDLSRLPTTDHRRSQYPTAYEDIWQHRVNNSDWNDDWVFYDSRFNILHSEDEVFLKFLCEMLHPVVRTDPEEVESLRQIFNKFLYQDGYEIIERTRMSNRPIFAARRVQLAGKEILKVKEAFKETTSEYAMRQITRMETAIRDDPDLAIGTAKELIETCCKSILKERGVQIDGNPDIPKLVKMTAKELNLTPEDIPGKPQTDDTLRRLLGSLATIPQSIAELRNIHGTGHGKELDTKGLGERHARLAAGTASALVVFLLETHQEKTGQS
jgi:hypothetical protein